MTWVLAVAIQRLIAEVNAEYPDRSKSIDGTIGDAAHSARWSESDHNPWLNNTVRAVDITAEGVPAFQLAEFIRQKGAAGDPRMNNGGYVIYNNRIASSKAGWSWRNYTGSNPHISHMHISVSQDPAGYNSSAPWGLNDGDFDLDDLPATGVPISAGTSVYIPSTVGSVSAAPEPGPWPLVAGGFRRSSHFIVASAESWEGQRSSLVAVSPGSGDPFTRDSGQPRTSEMRVSRYRAEGGLASAYMVTYAITASHEFYDAHWNIGIYASTGQESRLPRPGFKVETTWALLSQLQVLDGVATLAGQVFLPTREFSLALLSDWSAYGDLRPDILDGESRTREASMEVVSIEPYASGIAGALTGSEGFSLQVSDFNGTGIPGTMDIERQASYQGGGACY